MACCTSASVICGGFGGWLELPAAEEATETGADGCVLGFDGDCLCGGGGAASQSACVITSVALPALPPALWWTFAVAFISFGVALGDDVFGFAVLSVPAVKVLVQRGGFAPPVSLQVICSVPPMVTVRCGVRGMGEDVRKLCHVTPLFGVVVDSSDVDGRKEGRQEGRQLLGGWAA